jgi:predicted PurR-regulated permease PerM
MKPALAGAGQAVAPEAASPEAGSGSAGVVVETAPVVSRPPRYLRINVAVATLAIIALVAALYLARAFFIPLLLGILASYTLSPVVHWLQACRIPRPVAAALVLFVLAGAVSWLAFSLSDGAAAMTEKLPEAARKLRANLSVARSGNPTALQNVQEAATELQGAATDAGAKQGVRIPAAVRPSGAAPVTWLNDYLLTQGALLFAVVAQAPIVLLLTYFLLASGQHFRRKLVHFVGPSLSRKKDAVRILDEIDVQIQRYLLATLLTNVLVGIATWGAFKALGVEQAGVWGVAAAVLRFVPYLGTAIVAFASCVAAFLQFGSMSQALLVAAAAMVAAGSIGFVFMTWLQSRFAGVNASVLFVTLLFFGWLWGIWGLLLGAPLLAIAKVICDRIESLKPAGELLGR